MSPELIREHLRGFDAGRLQGWLEGRLAGYGLGYGEGVAAGRVEGWVALEEVDRVAFENYLSEFGGVLGQASYAELVRVRAAMGDAAVRPVRSPAECLESWG